MAKLFYSWKIGRDKEIPNTVIRSSTIPEELGRVSFLLSDKTGTLTKNEMVFKKMHLGTVAFGADSFEEVAKNVRTVYAEGGKVVKHSLSYKVQQAVEAIALCHNVTPLYDDDATEADQQRNSVQGNISYQAASPDEV